jgi:hypothetical protein
MSVSQDKILRATTPRGQGSAFFLPIAAAFTAVAVRVAVLPLYPLLPSISWLNSNGTVGRLAAAYTSYDPSRDHVLNKVRPKLGPR